MMGVDIQSLAGDPALVSTNTVGHLGYYGVFVSTHEATSVTSLSRATSVSRPRTQVDRTIEFALGRYENLLRKLAD